MNRGMEFVKTPIVIFSDANTNLGKESIRRIVNLFGNEKNLGNDSKLSDVAIMGIFADEDVIPGATQKDAATLKALRII